VETKNDISLALEKHLHPAIGLPSEPAAQPALNISVILTSFEATLLALRKAASLAGNLNACITVVVPQVVPYPLPLSSPPILLDWNERRFRTIAERSSMDTIVHLYLCRDRLETVKKVLAPGSLVVIGGRKRWWPTQESHLARQLRRDGHNVILTEME
jgi:hypothetical protein